VIGSTPLATTQRGHDHAIFCNARLLHCRAEAQQYLTGYPLGVFHSEHACSERMESRITYTYRSLSGSTRYGIDVSPLLHLLQQSVIHSVTVVSSSQDGNHPSPSDQITMPGLPPGTVKHWILLTYQPVIVTIFLVVAVAK
jgi:hypothetical protein